MRASDAREEARGYKQELLGRMFAAAPTADAGTVLGQVVPRGSNILGVGYGAKMVGDTSVEDLAVRVYVRAKRASTHLRADERIPEQVNGRPTDVIAVDDLTALERPVRCGVSVGHIAITAGTLGAVVERGGGDDDRYILSNNHVLAASNEAAIGDPILEPGPLDGGDPDDPIADLTEFVPIHFDGTANHVDAAVARLRDPADVIPEIIDIGAPKLPPVDAALYQSVRKHGRTTAHTVGVIVDVAADIRVRFGTRTALFVDQLAVVGIGDAFSAGGDSGSLIVDAVERNPVALLFAGGGATTFGNPIEPALERLSATIVGEDGAAP